MKIYWITLEVVFNVNMPVINDKNPNAEAKGFFQDIGCTAENENSAKQIVITYLNKSEWLDISEADIIFERIGEIPVDEINSEIYEDADIMHSLLSDPLTKGIWYVTGRAFYSDEMDDEDIFYAVEVQYTS